MEEYSDIRLIEDLYNEEEISGKSYLFCVDNDIDTLQDLQNLIADASSYVEVPEDLLLLCGSSCQAATNQTDASNNASCDISIQLVCEVASLETYKHLYDLAIKDCSVRTKNCLDRFQIIYDYPSDNFFKHLFDSNLSFHLKQIRNAGAKTIDEIRAIVSCIKDNIEIDISSPSLPNTNYKVELVDADEIKLTILWTVINSIKQGLSARCLNIVDKIITENNNSLVRLYNYFLSSKFNTKEIKGIGKKSGKELVWFSKEVVLLVDDCLQNNGANILGKVQRAKLETIICLPESDIELIETLSITLGYTPLFKLIDCVLKQDKRTSIIALEGTRIYNGVQVNLDLVCSNLQLTRERIRQLRNKIFTDLMAKIELWTQHFDFSHYEQYCSASWDKGNIFIDEGVDFSDDFIDIVSSILFKNNYALIGDIQECMMSFYDRKEALFIVPNSFAEVFDFNGLLIDIDKRVTGKIYEDYHIDLNHYMLSYFNNVIKFDFVNEIMEYLRLMLFEKFQLVVNEGKVELKKNANKCIPEYIEEILEENGAIMSIDDIYDIFETKYPGLTKNKTSLRGSILRSDRIVAISRSSNYALKEWESKGVKTGTIKDIIYDYLLGFSMPQSLESIEKYVIQHRPNTDANSIYNNLLLDNRGAFELLSLDDERFVAISTHEYGDEYINIRDNQQSTSRRTFQESMDLLYSFVLENQRFPFTSAPSAEEMRLGRFLGIVRAKRSNGKLTEEEESILNNFEADNIDKEISNEQYKWNLRYTELENHIIAYNRLPSSKYEPSLYAWLGKQKSNTNKGLLRNEDAMKIKTLLELVI